jgi:hypothetical protein
MMEEVTMRPRRKVKMALFAALLWFVSAISVLVQLKYYDDYSFHLPNNYEEEVIMKEESADSETQNTLVVTVETLAPAAPADKNSTTSNKNATADPQQLEEVTKSETSNNEPALTSDGKNISFNEDDPRPYSFQKQQNCSINHELTEFLSKQVKIGWEHETAPEWLQALCPEVVDHFNQFPLYSRLPLFLGDYSLPIQTTDYAAQSVCTIKFIRVLATAINSKVLLHAGSHLGAVRHGMPVSCCFYLHFTSSCIYVQTYTHNIRHSLIMI